MAIGLLLIACSSIIFCLGWIIYKSGNFLFSYFGNWLDDKYPNPDHIYVKILTLVGVAIAFYNINRQLKEINKST